MMLSSQDIEVIAQRVAELIRDPAPAPVRYVDARRVAEVLGVDREWVYAHARQLGAVRLGGPNGRLRFDLEHVRQALADKPVTESQPARPRGRRRPPRRGRARVDLLPYES
jgi:predicted DNA-binding transcriptional regulator AlpA